MTTNNSRGYTVSEIQAQFEGQETPAWYIRFTPNQPGQIEEFDNMLFLSENAAWAHALRMKELMPGFYSTALLIVGPQDVPRLSYPIEMWGVEMRTEHGWVLLQEGFGASEAVAHASRATLIEALPEICADDLRVVELAVNMKGRKE